MKEAFSEAGLEADLYRSESTEERKKWVKDYEVLLPVGPVKEDLINAAEKLRMIQVLGIGFDYIDVRTLSSRGILLCNTGGFIAETVAEHAWALLLSLARRVALGHMRIARGEHIVENNWWSPPWGDEVYGKTMGLIGLGNIGRRVARVARAFNMKILAYDPYLTEDTGQLYSAELTTLQNILKESDFVCITLPLTEESRGMIGKNEFSLMKPSAYLINVSRGPIIQERELIKVLREKKIAGAGLDVFENEPLPMDNELRNLENVVMTPHFGGASVDATRRMFKVIAKNIKKFLNGERPDWIVNIQELRRFEKVPKGFGP